MGARSYPTWPPKVRQSKEDLRRERNMTKLQPAIDFLSGLLSSGPKTQGEVMTAGRKAGISRQRLGQAADYGGVVFVTEEGKPVMWELESR